MPLRVIVVSGSIGAGKSSLLDTLQSCARYNKDVRVFPEDVTEWTFYLEKFYKHPTAYAFMFQKEVEAHFLRLTRTLEALADAAAQETVSVAVVERSPQDVLQVFLPLNKARMTPAEYDNLHFAMTQFADRDVWKNAKYYVVDCPVDECSRRILQRCRPGEDRIEKPYLTAVQSLYQAMMDRDPAIIRIDNYGNENSLLEASLRVAADILGDDENKIHAVMKK